MSSAETSLIVIARPVRWNMEGCSTACRQITISSIGRSPATQASWMVYDLLGLYTAIRRDEIPKEGRYSNSVGKMGEMYRKRYFRDATFDALRVIEPVVEKHNLTLIETALRWCVHHSALNIKDGGNDGIIIGVSSLEQLQGNLKDAEKGPLPEEVVKALDEAWLITKATTPVYWHLDLKYTYDTYEALWQPKK